MNINIIVALCKNNGIGINNTLPWKIKSDLKKFRNLTIGNGNNAVVMGKNTWLSINSKGLVKRDNLILSSTLEINEDISNNNISKSFNTINELEDFAKNKKYDNIWIIGGESIYKYFLNEYHNRNNICKLFVTYIDTELECDTFFPKIDTNKFSFISKSIHKSEPNIFDFNIFDKIYKSRI